MILKEERKNQAIWVSFKGPFPRPSRDRESLIPIHPPRGRPRT